MKHFTYIILSILSVWSLFAAESPHCLHFNDSAYVHIQDGALRFTTKFTLECWFNIEDFQDSTALIDFSTYKINEFQSFGYGIYVMDNERIAVRLGNFSKHFEMVIDSLKSGIWYHLAVTYDKFKNDENVIAFLNGRVYKKADCNIYLEYPETFRPYGVMLGAFYDYPFIKAFKGKLDDVRFWADIRTNKEILNYMDKSIEADAQGLVGYYTFDQTADSLLLDQSSHENHGILENMSDSSWQLSYAHIAVEQATDVSFNRLVLPWTSTHEFDSYCLDVSASEDFSASLEGFPVYDVNTNYFVIDQIDPGTYYYRVKGHYEGEELSQEPWTDIQSVSTVTDAATSIELSDLNLNAHKGSIAINWTVESQTENSLFVLERKDDLEDWNEIYRHPGEGTTSKTLSYSYNDEEILPGKRYQYRLKDVSYSGEISISKAYEIISETSGSGISPDIELKNAYPNPFNPRIGFELDVLRDSKVNISIFDISGQLVTSICKQDLQAGHYTFNWTSENESSGIYFLNISSGNNTLSHKLLLMK